MKINVILKPCPWCKKTPDINMPIDDRENSGGTWLWKICCKYICCPINPESPYVAIRGKNKHNFQGLAKKLQELAAKWNDKNDLRPFEMKTVDVSDICIIT